MDLGAVRVACFAHDLRNHQHGVDLGIFQALISQSLYADRSLATSTMHCFRLACMSLPSRCPGHYQCLLMVSQFSLIAPVLLTKFPFPLIPVPVTLTLFSVFTFTFTLSTSGPICFLNRRTLSKLVLLRFGIPQVSKCRVQISRIEWVGLPSLTQTDINIQELFLANTRVQQFLIVSHVRPSISNPHHKEGI